MYKHEENYVKLIEEILLHGEERITRNGLTKSIFGKTLEVDMSNSNIFPIFNGRKFYYKGVFGELAAMLRGPTHITDFEMFGCNYWGQWADDNGDIRVDYGNAWIDFNGVNQLERLIDTLRTNPKDRRMIISGWRPDKVEDLSLPCCHLLYQWYVRDDYYLDMIWYQRSVDTMIGLPSDIIFAAAWNIMIANEVGLRPGKLIFNLGDTHIYGEHIKDAYKYLEQAATFIGELPVWNINVPTGYPTQAFTPNSITISNYNPAEAIKFELKS